MSVYCVHIPPTPGLSVPCKKKYTRQLHHQQQHFLLYTHAHKQKAVPPTLRRDQSAIQMWSGYTHHSPNTHHSVLHMSSVHLPMQLQGECHVFSRISLYGHVHPELCICTRVQTGVGVQGLRCSKGIRDPIVQ